ncbi:MAG: hypothetical protein ACR2HS_00570 [Gammaproteobacteria bacterium]
MLHIKHNLKYNYKKIKLKLLILNIFLFGLSPFMDCQANNSADQLDKKYGNSQSEGFINAMYGLTPNISQEELQAINKITPINTNNKYFLRLGANTGSSSLIKITNISSKPIIQNAIIANDTETNNSKRSLEIAFGYTFNKLSLETELLVTQNMRYYRSQLFNNQNGSLDSIVKSKALLINGYYELLKLKSLRIFFGLGVGAGIISTNSRFFNSPVTAEQNYNKNNITGAFNLTLGGNLRVASQLFIKTSIRYTNFAGFGNIKNFSLGNIIWQDPDLNLYLKGQHKFFGFSLSMVHIID